MNNVLPFAEVRIHTDVQRDSSVAAEVVDWERVVFAEILVPETPNVYNDYWTREAVKEAAYGFMKNGFGIDINHDNVDRTGDVYVVESFIARDGDPDFISGSWVVAMKIENDEIWQAILDGDINGYSYEALMTFFEAQMSLTDSGVRVGFTEYYVAEDGTQHRHGFMVVVDPMDTRVSEGGTDEVNGHFHTISGGSVTDEADGHKHRYTLVEGQDGR